jgi:hypothetical protein
LGLSDTTVFKRVPKPPASMIACINIFFRNKLSSNAKLYY